MATRAKKKSRAKKRASRRGASSQLPVILLLLGALGVGGLLVVSERSDTGPTTSTVPTSASMAAAPTASTADTSVSTATIGSVAPPITVSDELLGEFEDESQLPDFTPVAPPVVPASLAALPASAVSNGRVESDLPDGFHLGYVEGALDDDGEYIAWRIGSADGPTYPGFVSDMIFTSVRVDARSADHPGSASLQPERLWQLLADGGSTVAVPESDDLVVLDGPYLLTVADGVVIAAEGIRPS